MNYLADVAALARKDLLLELRAKETVPARRTSPSCGEVTHAWAWTSAIGARRIGEPMRTAPQASAALPSRVIVTVVAGVPFWAAAAVAVWTSCWTAVSASSLPTAPFENASADRSTVMDPPRCVTAVRRAGRHGDA